MIGGQWSVVGGQWSVVSDQWVGIKGTVSCGNRPRMIIADLSNNRKDGDV